MQIEDYINENLIEEAKAIALDYVAFLRANDVEFHKDNSPCWENKIYYWLKFMGEIIGFLAIKDPDEPDNFWTVWSDDSKAFETENIDVKIKEEAWKHIDFCCNCGSCAGGKSKTVFGKEFNGVCGCTFRIDNPNVNDLSFLKNIFELLKEYILNNDPVNNLRSQMLGVRIMIRQAKVSDYIEIRKICEEDLGYPCSPELVKLRLEQLDNNRERVFVAFKNDEVAGFVHAEKYHTLYYKSMVNILGLAVAKPYRNQGIGKALMQEAENWAKENNIDIIRLNSGITRKEGHRFYRSIGYGSEKEQIRFMKKIR